MWRIVIGALVLAAGLYIVLGEHLAGVSSYAALNARLTTVRAPIEGVVKFQPDRIGAIVQIRERLGKIVNDRVDTSRLSELTYRRAQLVTEIRKTKKQIESNKAAREELKKQVDNYKGGRLEQLRARIDEAKAQIEAARARQSEARQALKRARVLQNRGVQTAARFDEARSEYMVALKNTEAARKRKAFLEVELAAARQGTYLGDSYNDAPYSWQRLKQLDLALETLHAELDSLKQRNTQVQALLDAERLRVSRFSQAEMASPVSGVVWNFPASSGETVRKGQPLLRIVNCNSIMITANVSERLYNQLQLGDAAQFRLFGEDRIYDATVSRLAGAGAKGRYENFAIAAMPEDEIGYEVLLQVSSLHGDDSVGCMVGRQGRVVFSDAPVDIVRKLIVLLGL